MNELTVVFSQNLRPYAHTHVRGRARECMLACVFISCLVNE